MSKCVKCNNPISLLHFCQYHGCLHIALLLFWQNCLGPLMDILKEHIVGMEKEHLISHQSELTAFFMKALDFRAEHAQVPCLGGWTEAAQHRFNSVWF